MRKNNNGRIPCYLVAISAFLAAWGFFQFAYPYHLMRREQLNLFMYDWDYIRQTYVGSGWLSHLAGDFIDQFLCFQVLGPILIALILTAIGAVTYRICRRFMGKWPSLLIAAAIFGWSFMRETGNLYQTQYSITTLGYLLLILAGMQFNRKWQKAAGVAAFVAAGFFAFGNPYRAYYGKLWGKPTMMNEKLIALDVNVARENWDKVLSLSKKKDLYINEASYFYNIATAKKGIMGNEHFNHSQNYVNSLFLMVEGNSQFVDGAAGEVWYHLGDMTLAEQSTIVAMQASPKHTGARFIKRLAEITMVSGEEEAAQKYLNMLSRTLRYRKWALSMLQENRSAGTEESLRAANSRLSGKDIIYISPLTYKELLKGLLEANPDNMMARQYLLMYDLVCCSLEEFMEYYSQNVIPGALYEQAALIWLNINDAVNEENVARYGISDQTLQRIQQFYRFPERYTNSYWHYYAGLMLDK